MADQFGISFVPGQQQPGGPGGEGDPSGGPVSPVQQAIRLLSLRLPKFSGPNGFAPPSLLNGPGAQGNPAFGPNPMFSAPPGGGGRGNPLLEALLRMAGGGGGGLPGMPGGGGTGAPHVIPGDLSNVPRPEPVGSAPVPIPPDAPSIMYNPAPPGTGNRGTGPTWSPMPAPGTMPPRKPWGQGY